MKVKNLKFTCIMSTIILLCSIQARTYAVDSTEAVASTEKAVKSAEEVVASIGEAAPSTGEVVPSSEEAVPSTGEAVPSTEEVVPNTEEAVPSIGEAVPSNGEAVPSTGEAVPSTGEAVPSTGEAVPSTGEAVPSTEEVVPSTGEAVPSTGEVVPSTGEAVPSTGEAVPSTGEAVPSTEEAVPSTEEVVPSTEEVVPSAEEVIPAEALPLQVNKDIIVTGSDAIPIAVDGYSDEWADKPYSYEYNWNNPSKIENYWDGTANITKEYKDENGKDYNTEIRHKMSMYCDGEYVYVHVTFSNQYQSRFNGEDYQFKFGDQMAAFQIENVGGGTITNNTGSLSQGIHKVEVRHRDSAMSYGVANGAEAYLNVKDNNINDELELKIPLTAMKAQNSNIDIENFQTVDFFTPNLMYRKISSSGTSTGPYMGVMMCMGVCSVGFLKINKRKKSF